MNDVHTFGLEVVHSTSGPKGELDMPCYERLGLGTNTNGIDPPAMIFTVADNQSRASIIEENTGYVGAFDGR